MDQIMPRARQESLIVVPLHDETLIYDRTRHQAMCLNPPVALVWKRCDGQSKLADVVPLLRQEIGNSVDEDIVTLALHQLYQHHLLDGVPSRPKADVVSMRRRLMKIGVAAAVLPLITLITAPTPAQSVSGPTGPTGPTGATGPT